MSSQHEQDLERLARLTLEHQQGRPVDGHAALRGVVNALTWEPKGRALLGLPGPDAITTDDTLAGLRLLVYQREDLDYQERALLEAAKDRGATWDTLGATLGRSGQAVQQRYKRLGGTRSWPTPPPRRGGTPAPAPHTKAV